MTPRAAARYGEDPRLIALVDELLEGSQTFRARWEDNDVREKTFRRKPVDHPDVGLLELDYEAFVLPGTSGQQLLLYSADPGTATAARLRRLASLAGS